MRSWELNGLNILINYTERAIFYPHPGSFENCLQIFGLILLVPRSEYKFLSLIVRHSFRHSLPKKGNNYNDFFLQRFLCSLLGVIHHLFHSQDQNIHSLYCSPYILS